MPALLLSLLSSVTIRWIIGAAMAAVVGYATYMIRDYKSLGAENATLSAQITQYKNSLEDEKKSRAIDAQTITVLNTRLASRFDDLSKACDLLQDVQQDKNPDSDAPVNGILGDILGRIDAPKSKSPPPASKPTTQPKK